MSTKIYPYTAGDQLQRIIGQFTRAFSGFQVMDGVGHDGNDPVLYRVPVLYATMDRLVAAMLNKRGYFKSNRAIPVMSVRHAGTQLYPQRRQASTIVDTYKNSDGSTTERLIGVPIIMNMEVSLICSSNTELYQLFEQIMLLFNPRLEVTVSDDGHNAENTIEIELTSINDERTIQLGGDKEVYQMTLSFDFKTALNYPYGFNDAIINQIEMNINSGDAILIVDEDT